MNRIRRKTKGKLELQKRLLLLVRVNHLPFSHFPFSNSFFSLRLTPLREISSLPPALPLCQPLPSQPASFLSLVRWGLKEPSKANWLTGGPTFASPTRGPGSSRSSCRSSNTLRPTLTLPRSLPEPTVFRWGRSRLPIRPSPPSRPGICSVTGPYAASMSGSAIGPKRASTVLNRRSRRRLLPHIKHCGVPVRVLSG